jgi:hypothetical protein
VPDFLAVTEIKRFHAGHYIFQPKDIHHDNSDGGFQRYTDVAVRFITADR